VVPRFDACRLTARAVHHGELFLIGGGRDEEGLVAAHAGLGDALAGGALLCLVADDGEGIDAARWRGMLTNAGVVDCEVVRVAEDRPPVPSDLVGFGGLYVAGGLTPLYAHLLAPLRGALPGAMLYAGYSAGAAIASEHALVGGWTLDGHAVCPEDAAEDLDEVTVRPGLGLVPFAVEVHATQWGTLARAIAAVRSGLVAEAWALDENTGLHLVDGGACDVRGAGQAHRITRSGDGVLVEAWPAGSRLER
jgi:cyanophycinase